MNKEIAIITEAEISFIEQNILNTKQVQMLLKKTPENFIKKRPAKGGGEWQYVTGGYVRKCLNMLFGFDWDFEIIHQEVMHGEAIVKGKLTCRIGDKTIIKTQFGNKEVIYQNDYIKDKDGRSQKVKSDRPLSIGNDLKAAATDALKKCAAELGIAGDVYGGDDFQETYIETITLEDVKMLFDEKKDLLNDVNKQACERVIAKAEVKQFKRTFDFLSNVTEKQDNGGEKC